MAEIAPHAAFEDAACALPSRPAQNGSSMRRLYCAVLVAASAAAAATGAVQTPLISIAYAQGADASAKDAFEAARALGTADAWNAFLKSYPNGFYADLARAYLKKLGETPATAAPAGPSRPPSAGLAAATAPGPDNSAAGYDLADLAPTDPNKPAVARGGRYMGFA